MVFFGLQQFIKKYLFDKFKKDFFDRPWNEVDEEYKYAINVNTDHIKALHQLGYLPLEIKALPEGSLVPMRVPCITIKNTKPEFFWLTNYIETLLSAQLWQPCTSATIAYEYKKLFNHYISKTVGNDYMWFTDWMGHDFSARGMSSVESMILSGMGHLTSFTGTDTIPAIYALKNNYKGEGLIGASVPATEHSVMCAGTGVEGEFETFKRLITEVYPSGILSIVSDTFDLWKVLTEYLPALKTEILNRQKDALGNAKVVIRPDSGDPVDIICGKEMKQWTQKNSPYEEKGVYELLWDTFGGTVVNGYKVLNPCVGTIYGDSITLDRAKQICEKLIAKGFAPMMVFGIGSYTYQYNTRDTFGLAMKATYIEVDGKGIEIFKDPITDDGTKKSAKGLLYVQKNSFNGDYELVDKVDWQLESQGELKTVFKDGKLLIETSLQEVRDRLKEEVLV